MAMLPLPRRMPRAGFLLLGLLPAACAGSRTGPSYLVGRNSVECAPYARQVTGIQLYGDAWHWWLAAAGRYARSREPSPGAVLVFRRSARLPEGHVSVVTAIDGTREIRVTQANWVHGQLSRNEPVLDVSPANDWTAVRVWWSPIGQLGSATYETYGFVLPTPPRLAANDAALCPPTAVE
jgi:hypothetical protein